jgi:hypothetical protein
MPDSSFLPAKNSKTVTWIENFARVANHHLDTLGIAKETIGELSNANAEFDADILRVETLKAELQAAVKARNAKRRVLIVQTARLNRFIQGREEVNDELKLKLGLNVRPARPAPVVPITPEQFSASGFSNGVNVLSWKRGANKPRTLYEIWYCEGIGGKWSLLATETKTRFVHQGVVPGVQIAYKVLARRADRRSEFSAVALVYGENASSAAALAKAA